MEAILTLNSGSSSIKFAAYTKSKSVVCRIFSGMVDRITSEPYLRIKNAFDQVVFEQNLNIDLNKDDPYQSAIHTILNELHKNDIQIIAAGHRMIHGGMRYRSATIVTDEVISVCESLIPLAPLHQPYNLKGVKILHEKFPQILQVLCFDTAFHTTCNAMSQLFAIPKWLHDDGVRRYGFHGLSYEYIVSQFDKYLATKKRDKNIIILHLGQGASMCGVKNRKSFTTSLGFSALDGLMMGTRTGSFDPGAMLFLMQHYKMDHKQLERLLYKESGLLGVSGISSDMRTLLTVEDEGATLAIDLFVYRAAQWIGAIAAEMQGVDGLIFTAGIGENAAAIREKICNQVAWLGAKINQEKNAEHAATIHARGSKLAIHVIPTNEELTIAEHTLRLLIANP